jgi:hypothetical protein
MLRNLLDINMGNLVLVDKLVLELDGKSMDISWRCFDASVTAFKMDC